MTAKPSGVWATAVGVARVRARETRRENPLFLDPLAEAFAVAGGLPVEGEPLHAPVDEAARRRWGAVGLSIVVRTRFLDELLGDAVAAGCRQVVLLGAGMDSRAYRLDWPSGTRLFEIDTAEPLDFKESVLRAERAEPHCERITVPSDLRDDWPGALSASGHDPALPTVWIAEGLLIYLPQDAVDRLLGQVGELSASGSRMGLTLGQPGVLERFAQDTGTPASMWLSEMPSDPVTWLDGLGWDARAHTLRERAAAYGRPVATPEEQPPRHGGLISAVRR
ncbi:class I SAM-dependent methyltransferase [Streptomyces sp. NPDC051362]|uniref:class I SAM-dependent methyltransferase n=1 Tax=Streptomyces sp. NPDC051362 TaxID=3365651 RepID=UPI00379BE580